MFGNSPPSTPQETTTTNTQPKDESFDMFSESPSALNAVPTSPNSIVPTSIEIQADSEGYALLRAGEKLGDRYVVEISKNSFQIAKILEFEVIERECIIDYQFRMKNNYLSFFTNNEN